MIIWCFTVLLQTSVNHTSIFPGSTAQRNSHLDHQHLACAANMSDDNNYDGDEGGDAYDVFQEEEEPAQEEQMPLEADPADMEIVDEGDAGGAGLRSADDRITTKYMTKYERARILGTRALQIRYGGLTSCKGALDF